MVDLVIVVMSMEKRFLPEDHTGQHASKTPHIQTVVIHLERDQNIYLTNSKISTGIVIKCENHN